MNEIQRNFILNKMTTTQLFIDKSIESKKELQSGYSRNIKESKKRMSCYAQALHEKNIDLLADYCCDGELETIKRLGD